MKAPLIIFFLSLFLTAKSQHIHSEKDTSKAHEAPLSHSFSLNLPIERNGSGTSWMPDASVMYGYGMHLQRWHLMFHTNIFTRFNKQDFTQKSRRGSTKIDAPNWIMAMAQRRSGQKGLFHFNAMLSLEPFTVGGEGYPLLFQSGETFNGQRLVDRQHPHDFFSELSAAYTYMLSNNADVFAYLGYPGEPALGPVTFMHRPSAANNPDAPLGHHTVDATHISFGVATLGLRLGNFKIESSQFTGKEPDENRYNFDKPRFDSYALRLSYNPFSNLALQASQAYINSPEALEPGENVVRSTASAIHQLSFSQQNHYLATAFVWGNNQSHESQNSLLVESSLQIDKTAVYGRWEWVERSAEDLDLSSSDLDNVFDIQALTIGTNHVLLRLYGNNLAAGIQGSIFFASDLNSFYGKNPLSAEIYFRFYPKLMKRHHLE